MFVTAPRDTFKGTGECRKAVAGTGEAIRRGHFLCPRYGSAVSPAERMTVYFAGSIRGGREDARLYRELVTLLSGLATVLTEHVGSDLDAAGESGLDDRGIHDRDLAWLTLADAVIAEVTVPSHGVGYEIARALALGKPVLCLHRPGSGRPLSAMIAGAPGVEHAAYSTPAEAGAAVERFLARRAPRPPSG